MFPSGPPKPPALGPAKDCCVNMLVGQLDSMSRVNVRPVQKQRLDAAMQLRSRGMFQTAVRHGQG